MHVYFKNMPKLTWDQNISVWIALWRLPVEEVNLAVVTSVVVVLAGEEVGTLLCSDVLAVEATVVDTEISPKIVDSILFETY